MRRKKKKKKKRGGRRKDEKNMYNTVQLKMLGVESFGNEYTDNK